MSSVADEVTRPFPAGDSGKPWNAPSDRCCVSVREGYERWAPTYDRDPNPLLALEERWLQTLIPPLKGKRVLDLACGTGRWLAWQLTQRATSVVGVDFSAAMLSVARKKPALHQRLVQADCREIPFAHASFDLVVCSFALAHIFDLNSVVREVSRVSAAGADVLVSDLHPVAYAHGWRTGFRDHQGAAEIATRPRSAQDLVAAWIAAGFKCVHSADCRLGEPERPIFARTGKDRLFEAACHIPAILILHFRRAAGYRAWTKK
ncbi:MAG: class I SAM-dependent methyltransferase [Terriglobia bacterium]